MQFTSPRVYVFLFFTLFAAALHPSAEAGSKKQAVPKSLGRTADTALPVNFAVMTTEDQSCRTALSMIRFPWQDLGYRISFQGRRPGFRALTLVDEHRIEVYVKGEDAPDSLAFDLAHEFGHVVDLRFNNEERRKHWMRMRGIDPSTPWFGESAASDFDTPAGDFAETFAYLLLGPGNYHSRMAPPPTPEQIRELAEFCHIEHISDSLLSPVSTQ